MTGPRGFASLPEPGIWLGSDLPRKHGSRVVTQVRIHRCITAPSSLHTKAHGRVVRVIERDDESGPSTPTADAGHHAQPLLMACPQEQDLRDVSDDRRWLRVQVRGVPLHESAETDERLGDVVIPHLDQLPGERPVLPAELKGHARLRGVDSYPEVLSPTNVYLRAIPPAKRALVSGGQDGFSQV